jgi:glycosyltransferase involved in cell wall biosynthesis
MSALESLAAGLPILVSDGIPVGKWAAQVGAGKIALSDPSVFTKAAAELLINPEYLKEMGECGRELVRQKFDIQIVAQQMLDQFRAIVDTGRPLPSDDI